MRLILNTSFPTFDNYINRDLSKRVSLKNKTESKVCFLAEVQDFKIPIDTLYNIHFTWYKPDNNISNIDISFAKRFIIAGLIKAGSLENNSHKFINNFCNFFEICKNRTYISCIVDFIPVKK